MTTSTLVTITNRALAAIGTRTTVSSMTENSTEAIQSNLVIEGLRDELIRMAPWNCATNYANLTLITAAPGTPENPTPATTSWQKGLPPPPWAYEYQFPVDCLRMLWIVPQFSSGFASGVPITTAVTGGAPWFWSGPPARYKVIVDQFFAAIGVAIAAGGTGYAAGDTITLATPSGGLGAPAKVLVGTVAGGVITAASLVPNVFGDTYSGSYLTVPANSVAQGSSTGVGTGATFNLTFSSPPAQVDQRTIVTNQEFATGVYLRRVTDPNVMDDMFIEAWVKILGARLAIQLTGDVALANQKVNEANGYIEVARSVDGNEGLTINNVTPDWIRTRGIIYDGYANMNSPAVAYDWGPMFGLY
jgi:hypothetical protein